MTTILISFAVGYLLARNQETLLGLLTRKVAKELEPPNDPPAKP